jgi:23S rRNA (guanosine2251-2'-O)-methyltransferase
MSDRGQGWVVGYHAVLAALEGGRSVEVLWLLAGRGDRRASRLLDAARSARVPVKRVERRQLDRVASDIAHNGCAARVAPVAYVAPEALVRPPGEVGRVVLIDDVSDPHNLGALVRVAAAFQVDGLIVAGPHPPPLAGAVAKAAAGQLERVPLARVTVAADALRLLKGNQYWVYGADRTGEPVATVDPGARWVLCLGSEERGLRAKTRSQVDAWVSVPMADGVESLNVSVAGGVLVYAMVAAGLATAR